MWWEEEERRGEEDENEKSVYVRNINLEYVIYYDSKQSRCLYDLTSQPYRIVPFTNQKLFSLFFCFKLFSFLPLVRALVLNLFFLHKFHLFMKYSVEKNNHWSSYSDNNSYNIVILRVFVFIVMKTWMDVLEWFNFLLARLKSKWIKQKKNHYFLPIFSSCLKFLNQHIFFTNHQEKMVKKLMRSNYRVFQNPAAIFLEHVQELKFYRSSKLSSKVKNWVLEALSSQLRPVTSLSQDNWKNSSEVERH